MPLTLAPVTARIAFKNRDNSHQAALDIGTVLVENSVHLRVAHVLGTARMHTHVGGNNTGSMPFQELWTRGYRDWNASAAPDTVNISHVYTSHIS